MTRRRRRLAVLLVVVVVGVGALDQGARLVAQNVAARALQHRLGGSMPAVSLGGFPFLPQAVAGRYRDVTVHDAVLIRDGVTFGPVDLTATGVRVPRHGPVSAATVAGTAVIPWSSLASRLPSGVTLAAGPQPDTVTAKVPVSVAGISARVDVTASIATANGTEVTVTPQTAGVSLPVLGGAQLPLPVGAVAPFTVAIPGLPVGMAVTAVASSPTGLVATVSGRDVVVSVR